MEKVKQEPTSVFVKPIEGATVRDPGTFSPLPKTGALVTLEGKDGTYWRRKLYFDKSVVKAEPPIKGAMRTAPPEPDKKGGKK